MRAAETNRPHLRLPRKQESRHYPERKGYEIAWPNVVRIDHEYRPTLTLDLAKAKPLLLDAYETPTFAQLAPIIEGKPDVTTNI